MAEASTLKVATTTARTEATTAIVAEAAGVLQPPHARLGNRFSQAVEVAELFLTAPLHVRLALHLSDAAILAMVGTSTGTMTGQVASSGEVERPNTDMDLTLVASCAD